MGIAASLSATGHAQISSTLSGPVLRRPIPGTSEMLPLIGFGSSAAVTQILQDGPALVAELVETMVNLGASMIDTAPREVAVDEAFGRILSDPRWSDKLFVNTKIGRNRAANIRSLDKQGGVDQIHQTEKLFNRKPADLIQVDSMIDIGVHWPTLREAKSNGDARYIGITTSNTSGHAQMEAFMQSERPDFIQVNYSLLEPDAEARILPLARDLGIAVIINTPFGGGEYFQRVRGLPLPDWAADFDCSSWAQFNLKYILGEPVVNCILTETTRVANLQENLLVATSRLPDPAMRKKMKSYFDLQIKG
jgi:aryl-alcohol dehydrogenase-like predicted oxidoreductase